MGKELMLWCEHMSCSGGEGPVEVLGRMPVLWICDSCGNAEVLV